jgi:endonuclease/exonuclease/phosphatase family metal-dependent hydrolase
MNPNLNKRTIKVGTFNLFNLVLPEVQYYETRKYSHTDYQKKLEWIGYQLNQMNADIVAFQELFHREALLEAIENSKIYSGARVLAANPTGEFPVVGLVSRFPVVDSEIIENFPPEAIVDVEREESMERTVLPFNKFSRAVLKARIKIREDLDITVFVIHLKSKRPDFIKGENRDNPMDLVKAQVRSLILRACEAAAVRAILLKTMENTKNPVIVMGDVNDSGLAVTTKLVSGEPPQRRLPLEIKKGIWDVLLYHVKDIQARRSYQDFYFTHMHNGYYDSLDHIMVSQELVSENPLSVGRIGNVMLFNDHLIDDTLTNDKVPCWKTDHGLVLATIELNEPSKKLEMSEQFKKMEIPPIGI